MAPHTSGRGRPQTFRPRVPPSEPAHSPRWVVGVVLRAPVIFVLAWMWLYVLVPLGILLSLAGIAWLIVVPLCYLPLAALHWLFLALINSSSPVLPHYWDYYPESFAQLRRELPREAREFVTLGFPTLYRWLMHGFPALL